MKKVFAIVNHKGGVAKSTSAINLGYAFSQMGEKTLIIDADPQANASRGLGFNVGENDPSIYDLFSDEATEFTLNDIIQSTKFNNLWIIPSNITLARVEANEMTGYEYVIANLIKEIWNKFDYVLIDTPPSLARLTKSSLAGATHMLIPVQCEYFALLGVAEIMKTLQIIQKKLNSHLELGGAFITMLDPRSKYVQSTIESVKNYFKNKAFQTTIPRTIRVPESQENEKPVQVYNSEHNVSQAYNELAKEVIA
jgi:chromosome partitioning protein